jgi:hypothetical protein
MVRLKACINSSSSKNMLIFQFQYGAIKSFRQSAHDSAESPFQFQYGAINPDQGLLGFQLFAG